MLTGGHLKNRQKGISLIEILVTIAVMAIGLLGIAGLIVTSAQNNQGAYYRTQATMLAHDVIERMRANKVAALQGQYNISVGGSAAGGSLAASDVNAWKSALNMELPNGDGSVTVDINGNVSVVVTWNDSRNAANARDVSFSTSSRL